MREKQTSPKQPRDEDGRVHDSDARIESDPAAAEPPAVPDTPVAGRDRAPEGVPRRNSPWLGGG